MPNLPPYLALEPALKIFLSDVAYQSQGHIKPLHQHLALRLVLEGGFSPDEITPRPPLVSDRLGRLSFDLSSANSVEQTVLGGLKSKSIDVVVSKTGVGPVLAISVKGTLNAFRNLTNRMEEAIGDATNIHLMYPGLVYGFFHVLKATRADTPGVVPNDVAITMDGQAVPGIKRYAEVLTALHGRRLVRDEFSRYETVALALIDPTTSASGHLLRSFPLEESPLRTDRFFSTLLNIYDIRFPYVAPSITTLRRRIWRADSPALKALGNEKQWETRLGYRPRVE